MNLRQMATMAWLCLGANAAFASTLQINISGVETQSGSIRVAIYNSADSFRKEPHIAKSIPANATDVLLSIDDLPAGEFAVMLFHDIDGNEKLNTNIVGMPREPWGASLQGSSLFGPPKWKDVMFEHSADGTVLNIALQ